MWSRDILQQFCRTFGNIWSRDISIPTCGHVNLTYWHCNSHGYCELLNKILELIIIILSNITSSNQPGTEKRSEGRLISVNSVVLSGRSLSSVKRMTMTSETNTTESSLSLLTGSGSAGWGRGVSEGGVVFLESPLCPPGTDTLICGGVCGPLYLGITRL